MLKVKRGYVAAAVGGLFHPQNTGTAEMKLDLSSEAHTPQHNPRL